MFSMLLRRKRRPRFFVGRRFFKRGTEIEKVLNRLGTNLRSQYTLGYFIRLNPMTAVFIPFRCAPEPAIVSEPDKANNRRLRLLRGRPSPIRLRMADGIVDRGFLKAIHKMRPRRTNSRQRRVAPDRRRTDRAGHVPQDGLVSVRKLEYSRRVTGVRAISNVSIQT